MQIIAHLQTFVAQADSTIAVQGVCLDVDGSCSIVINSFGDPQCTTAGPSVTTPMTTLSTTTMTPQSDSTTAIIGGVVAVVIVVTLAVIVVIIAIAVLVTKSRKRQFAIHQNVG